MSHFLELVLRFVIEVFFERICGFTGYWTIWILTFGRVNPDPHAVSTFLIGLVVFFGVPILIVWKLISTD